MRAGTNLTNAAKQHAHFPHGFANAFWFSLFNAFSFQIILSSPMVLYAKSLGAKRHRPGDSRRHDAIARHLPNSSGRLRAACRLQKFVYGGWGMRVLFIGAMAMVPVTTSFLNEAARLALILALSFLFNLSRGISSCAWLPWITSLIPATLRGNISPATPRA